MRNVDRVLAELARHRGPISSWLIGEPCVEPPEGLGRAFQRAARAQAFPYPPIAGLPRLRRVLADHHSSEGSPTSFDQIAVTAGAKGGLFAVLAALLEPGDELIHPIPCYPAYPTIATRLGARPVGVSEGPEGFGGWAPAVAKHLTSRTRAVVLSSPSNPTGATLDRSAASELVELCRSRGVRLVCDEAYADYRFAEDTDVIAADFDPSRSTVIQIRSVSKSWALCGWRVGWIVADQQTAARAAGCHASFLNPASGPAQEALLDLLNVGESYIENARNMVAQRIADLRQALRETGIVTPKPAGGFYLWADIRPLLAHRDHESAAEFCCDLARRSGVGLWPGEDFHGPGHVRLSATSPPPASWQQAVDQLTSAVG